MIEFDENNLIVEKEQKERKVRRVIYIDAGWNNEQYQIGLYDSHSSFTQIVALVDIKGIHLAELYGALSAIIYIYTKQIDNAIILCDNLSVTENHMILKLCEKHKIKITWIPREINVVADKLTKLTPIKKQEVFYNIKLLFDTLFN